jgi:hypothetical protein
MLRASILLKGIIVTLIRRPPFSSSSFPVGDCRLVSFEIPGISQSIPLLYDEKDDDDPTYFLDQLPNHVFQASKLLPLQDEDTLNKTLIYHCWEFNLVLGFYN